METGQGSMAFGRVYVVAAIAAVHILVLGAVGLMRFERVLPIEAAQVPLVIEIAEIILPEPEPEPEPEPVSRPAPDVQAQPTLPTITSPDVSDLQERDVSQDIAPYIAPLPAPIARQGPDEAATDAQAAYALRSFRCGQLGREKSDECDDMPPSPSEPLPDDSGGARFVQLDTFPFEKNTMETFFSQDEQEPYLMPGMSGEMFADPMAKGAYNADRIRNGQSPIFDRQLERDLRAQGRD